MVLRENLEKSGRFNILSKRQWCSYPMPPAAQHINVLRVVIRAEFSRTLAQRLAFNIHNVLHELQKVHGPPMSNSTEEDNKALVETGAKETTLDAHRAIIVQESNKRQKIMAALALRLFLNIPIK